MDRLYVLGLRRADGADKRVDLPLGVAFRFLHQEASGNVPVRGNRLDKQNYAEDKTHDDEGLEEEKFLAFSRHGSASPHFYIRMGREIIYKGRCEGDREAELGMPQG